MLASQSGWAQFQMHAEILQAVILCALQTYELSTSAAPRFACTVRSADRNLFRSPNCFPLAIPHSKPTGSLASEAGGEQSKWLVVADNSDERASGAERGVGRPPEASSVVVAVAK